MIDFELLYKKADITPSCQGRVDFLAGKTDPRISSPYLLGTKAHAQYVTAFNNAYCDYKNGRLTEALC